jgi:hypothetical protein
MKKKSTKSAINIVNLNNYNSPDIQINKQKDWVTFGDKNSYFKYLIDRYSGSPTNNAIVNGVSQMIYGKGIDATDNSIFPNEYAQAVTLLNKECVRKLTYDLKLMGQCAIQVIYSKDRKNIAQVEHMPVETLAMEKCNDKGEIEAYYYFPDWSAIKPTDKPTRIPAFGSSKEAIEILYVRPYVAGHYYFSPVDYQGGLQYAELEEEIANYHLNNILNGLAPSMLINFNNGVPNEEQRAQIERSIKDKYSGSSNAGRFILSFNENADTESSIEAIQLSDAHNQYQFLSDESMRKIMVSHRIVSPMLLGIKDQSGLGNNADELKTASILMDNTVIRPFQELLLDAFDKILAFNGITLNLYFKTLQPLEFVEIDTEIVDDETIEEETGVEQLSADPNEPYQLGEDDTQVLLGSLKADEMTDDWEFVDKRDHDDSMMSHEDWATICIEEKENLFTELAGKVIPKNKQKNENTFSYLDKSFYRVRYRYKETRPSDNSREFCTAMMKRIGSDGKPAVYRIEDIDTASKKGVNQKFGHKKKPYDLFRWKGGPYCHHVWEAVLYRLKNKTKPSKYLKNYLETGSIPKTYQPTPYGHKDAKIAPVDMENGGHHPNWNK